MISTWRAAAGILLVFVFGCVSGGLSTSLYFRNEVLSLERSPSEVADILQNRFTHHLGLDPDQREQVHRILMDYLRDRKQLTATLQPQMKVLNQDMIGRIQGVLHPDQVDGFQDNLAELRRTLAHTPYRPPEMAPASTLGGVNAAPDGNAATNATPLP